MFTFQQSDLTSEMYKTVFSHYFQKHIYTIRAYKGVHVKHIHFMRFIQSARYKNETKVHTKRNKYALKQVYNNFTGVKYRALYRPYTAMVFLLKSYLYKTSTKIKRKKRNKFFNLPEYFETQLQYYICCAKRTRHFRLSFLIENEDS